MATTQTVTIQCDHVSQMKLHRQPCSVKALQADLMPEAPMYHVSLTLTAIDASGSTVLETLERDVCIWDLYQELSEVYDREKERVDRLKAKRAALEEGPNEGE